MASIWEDKRREKNERRKVLRTIISLPIEITSEDKTYTGKTGDMSRLGASFVLGESFPEFSRVHAVIKLPFRKNKQPITIEAPIIIVNCRRLPHAKKKFRMGFYYDDLTTQFQGNVKELLKRLKKKLREEKRLKKLSEPEEIFDDVSNEMDE